MITRQTSVSVIEINSDKSVGVRLALMLVEDGEVLDSKWHRTLIGSAGTGTASPEVQMAAVNTQLVDELSVEPVSAEDIARISKFYALAQQ